MARVWSRKGGRLVVLAGIALLSPGIAATALAQTAVTYTNGDNNAAPIVLVDPLGTVLVLPSGLAEQSGDISELGGPRALDKIGAGELILSGTNTYSGATTVLEGTLTATSDLAFSDLSAFRVNKDATLKLDDSLGALDAAIGSLADGPGGGGNVALGVDPSTLLSVGYDNTSTTFSGVITGAGSFEKVGTGTLTLTGKGSSIGGVLTICDCTGVGGLNFAGGTFIASDVEIVDGGRLLVTQGGKLTGQFSAAFDGGDVLVDGVGSKLTTSILFALDSDIVVSGGGLIDQNDSFAGMLFSTSSLQVVGAGSKVIAAGVGQFLDSDVTVTGGRLQASGLQFSTSSFSVGSGGSVIQTQPLFGLIFDSGEMLVDGPGTLVDIAGSTEFTTFFDSVSLTVSNGATFRSRGDVALDGFAPGGGFPALAAVATVTGAGSLWTIGGDLVLGCACGPATLNVANGGEVRAAGEINIGNGSVVNLGVGGQAGKIVTPEIVNNGALVANFTDSSTLAAVISGLGTLTKNGAGKLILSAVDTYTGNTAVNKGILAVDGSIANSNVFVNNGGTLGGNGTVGTTTVNAGGAIGPGNSVGTLTVLNSLTFAAGSKYQVEVGNGADLTKVVAGLGGPGNAVLSGGAVEATYGNSGTVKNRELVLNAAGGLGGTTFTGVTDNLPGVVSSLEYEPGNVFLVSKLSLSGINGLTVNQTNVANAVDNFFAGKTSFDLAFGSLDADGLTIASGELGTAAIQSGFIASDLFIDVISDRFVQAGPAQSGATEDTATAYASEGGASSVSTGAYAALLDKKSAFPMGLSNGQWKAWGAVYGATGNVDGERTVVGSHDLDTDVWGLASGIGWSEGDVSFGVALGGGHSSFSLDGGLGSGDAGTFNAGIHGRAEFGEAYILGALAYGYHDVSTSRVAFGEVLEAGYDAHSFSGRAEAGYRFETALAGFTPYVAFQGTALHTPSYSETSSGTGTFALNYAGDTATTARGEFGLRFDKAIAMETALLTLTGRAAWAHASDNDRRLVAGFQSLPGSSFTVYGAEPGGDSALLDLGAKLAWQNGWSTAFAFQGQFAEGYDLYSGSLKLGFAW